MTTLQATPIAPSLKSAVDLRRDSLCYPRSKNCSVVLALQSSPGRVGQRLGTIVERSRQASSASWPTRAMDSSRTILCKAVVQESGNFTELKEGIANFYDQSSGLWEDMWGEHMHHGYYPPGSSVDHRQAQIDMIEKSLEWAGIPDSEGQKPRTVVDVGCGIGGSARHLARKYGATVKAITLSPVQAQRGNAICASQGLANQVELQVGDALQQPFEDGQFDLVWSMESGEHMPNKPKFVGELARVAAPGGRILIVTWCHRNLGPNETSLKPDEEALLDRVCKAYYLPAWCSADDYVRLAQEAGLKNIKADDWTEFVTPFWPAVMASALTVKGILGLFRSGWTTMRGALAMALMVQGYSKGLIKFALITAQKPE